MLETWDMYERGKEKREGENRDAKKFMAVECGGGAGKLLCRAVIPNRVVLVQVSELMNEINQLQTM